jgi:hypothetical protein
LKWEIALKWRFSRFKEIGSQANLPAKYYQSLEVIA